MDFDPVAVAEAFGMTNARWSVVCQWSERFYRKVAPLRFDPSERERMIERYAEAAGALTAGAPLGAVGLPCLGVRPFPPE